MTEEKTDGAPAQSAEPRSPGLWPGWMLLPVALGIFGLALAALVGGLSLPRLPGQFEVQADGAAVYVDAAGAPYVRPSLSAPGSHCLEPVIALNPDDVRADVDVFDAVAQARQALRQAHIRCLLSQSGVQISASGAKGEARTLPLTVGHRTFKDLSAHFWVPWIIGIVSALAAGWVWALRPKALSTALFAVNGAAFMAAFLVQAVYKAQAPGFDAHFLATLYLVNYLANQVFYLSLMALFLFYPVRLMPLRRAWPIAVFVGLDALCLFAMGRTDLPVYILLMVVELLAIIGFAVWQWLATRRLPRERAALTWMALSVIVGAAIWICTLLVSHSLGHDEVLSSPYVTVLFFPFYIGLAMGVARFCLVELQDWTFRILYLTLSALLFVAIDAALVLVLGLARGPAVGLSLLAVAFAYLPLRDIVWRRFVRGRTMNRPDMFAAVMEIAFALTPAQRRERWQDLARKLFDPLDIEVADTAVGEAHITEGGLRLILPAVADSPSLILSYARQGRALFSPSQLSLVRQLVALVRNAGSSRDAYERGAAAERSRLAQDLHDDVGARLLSGLHTADEGTRPILHAALADIRTIVSGMTGADAPLERVLADVRHECVRRLEAAGIAVDWPLLPDNAPLVLAGYRLQKAIASSLREVVSNIIRHSGARHAEVELRLEETRIVCRIRDDGAGFSDANLSGEAAGQGLKGVARRLDEAGGRARFGNGPAGGAQVEIELPLHNP